MHGPDSPEVWDQMAKEHGGAPPAAGMEQALVALRERLGPEDCVVDVGCGSGPVVRAIAPMVTHVHGIDTSGEMLRRARENPPRNATFQQGTLEDYAGPVSVAVMFNVLHHLDLAATFSRLLQIMVPGGLLFAFEARHEHAGHEGDAEHVPFTPQRLRAVLKEAGFAVEAFAEVGAGAWAAARNADDA